MRDLDKASSEVMPMENKLLKECYLADYQLVSILNSSTQIYHRVQITVHEGRDKYQISTKTWKHVISLGGGLFVSLSLFPHWLFQILGIVMQGLLLY